MLIKSGLSQQNLAEWKQANPGKKQNERIDLLVIASKSKHASIIPKIIYSIIEIFKSLYGNSNYQKSFKDYKDITIEKLTDKELDPKDFKNKDYKLVFECFVKYAVLDNDLQIEKASSEIADAKLKEFQKACELKMEKLNLTSLLLA